MAIVLAIRLSSCILPVFRKVQDERVGGQSTVALVYQHQAPARLKPGKTFPVCVVNVFGKELSQIKGLPDWLSLQVKSLQPMVKILWPFH